MYSHVNTCTCIHACVWVNIHAICMGLCVHTYSRVCPVISPSLYIAHMYIRSCTDTHHLRVEMRCGRLRRSESSYGKAVCPRPKASPLYSRCVTAQLSSSDSVGPTDSIQVHRESRAKVCMCIAQLVPRPVLIN